MIVFVHGLGCDKSDFDLMAVQLNLAVEILSLQLPKYRSQMADPTNDLFEDAINTLVKKLQYETDIDFVAHSLGSAIALPVAEKLGDAVKSITLFEANLIGDDCKLLSRSLSELKLETSVQQFLDGFSKSESKNLRKWAERASTYDPILLIDYAKELVAVSDSEVLFRSFMALNCKKKYVYSDEYLSSETVKRIIDTSPIHISGTSHFLMIERPKKCVEILSGQISNVL